MSDISDIQERIRLAIKRITDGHAAMRVPPDHTDPDIVLSACGARIANLEAQLSAVPEEQRKWEDRYRREVMGENNEGDYIGGVPGGLRYDLAKTRAELEEAKRLLTMLHDADANGVLDDSMFATVRKFMLGEKFMTEGAASPSGPHGG